jgi:hypothetical protein
MTMKMEAAIGAVIVIMLSLLTLHAEAEGLGNARLNFMEGDVQIKPEDSVDWLPAAINMPLREGDSIWVPDSGKAEVQGIGGTQVRLDGRSSLEILNLGKDSMQVYLSGGSTYVNVAGRSMLVQVDTPISSIRTHDRTAFAVDVANGDTDISVYKGSVTAESSNGRTTVTAGKMLSLGNDYADLFPLGRSDEWERWNMDRDRRFEDRRYASSRYLPEELDAYASDFDDNGRWVSVRDYGYVWTPTVSVSVGWSPYRHGRWCWIGGDYVWVGYEPWGWAPYHYGRWSYAASVGWFWVPPVRGSVYWGPGYVGWVSTPTYVAWVPLAPRETYYGHGYYGPHSVNIVNMQVNTIVVKNVYKNVYVTNGVTIVHHDTFVKGRHVDFKHRENPFLKEKVHIGRPNIKPERETRMPVMKDIPRAKEPPQRIKEIRVKEIKKQRPLITEKNRSVFAPEAPGRELKVRTSDAPKERKRAWASEGRQEQDRGWKPEKRGSDPAEKQKHEDRGSRPRDLKEMKQKESRPDPQPADRPSQRERQRQTEEQKRQRAEKLRKEGAGAGSQPYSASQTRKRQPEQLEQQKQQAEKRGERTKGKEIRVPDQGGPAEMPMTQAERRPEKERGTASDRRRQLEERRSQGGSDDAAPQKQFKQQERQKKVIEQQEVLTPEPGQGQLQPSEAGGHKYR